MLIENKNIICISSIDWDFIWQGHQEIMTRLARSGNRVLYVENTGVRSPKLSDIGRIRRRISNWRKGLWGFREVESNLFVFSPLVIPFPYSKTAQAVNTWFLLRIIKRWMESTSFHDPVIWTFLPTQLTINLIRQIKNRCVIYYCIDSFVDSSDGAKRIVASEEALYRLSDLVFVTSHNLFDKASRFNRNVHFFPFAVNLENFQIENSCKDSRPVELKSIKGVILGYVGGIHRWIDLDLIAAAARERPDWTFVMVGPIQTNITSLEKIKNVLFLGGKGHNELPYFIKCFDVCIIPYAVTEYTRNVYPTKLTEYMSMGKPVVATPIAEIERFDRDHPGLIALAGDKKEFIRSMEDCIKNDDGEVQKERIKAAEKNTWGGHLEKMSSLIDDKIKDKENMPVSWQEQFKSFYYQKKWTISKYIIYACLVWILFFHTSLFWLIARPLIIQSPMRQADVIVALGGGVGESGQAGQGYIERAKKAIDIYKGNNSPYTLFMSGYAYLMKEAEMMKAFGVEYGIPENRILIDTKASNTYLSVLRIAAISMSRGWNTVIFISSPYHMLRAQLCFKKIAPQLQVIYTPVTRSSFYSWPKSLKMISWNKQITLKQLRGLLHEVFGIVYYRFKGYI